MTTIYLDSCIAIYRVERVLPWALRVDSAFDARSTDKFVASELARMECRVGPLKQHSPAVLARFEQFFERIELLPLTRAVFDRAAELRAHHNLRTPDAIHVAAALTHGCDEFWTNDNRLAGISDDLQMRVFAS